MVFHLLVQLKWVNSHGGKLSTVTRSSTPISIGVTGLTVGLATASGISTFPTIQRRNYGFNDGGALKADLG